MKFIRAFTLMILIAVMIVCGYIIEKKLNEYRVAEDFKTSVTEEYKKSDGIDFDKLKKRNEDVIAWIKIPDTRIDYPVVQGKDNDYYLHRDLDGNYLFDGTIFVDANVERPFEDDNTILYGHKMISGAMFADVKYYADKEYMQEHPVVYIETPGKSYELPVVAYCEEYADSDIYTTYMSDGMEVYDGEEGSFNKTALVDLIRSRAKVSIDACNDPVS